MADLLGLDNLRALPDTPDKPNPYFENGKQYIRVASKKVTRSKGCDCLCDPPGGRHIPLGALQASLVEHHAVYALELGSERGQEPAGSATVQGSHPLLLIHP